jgi:hypothetical protein
MCLEFGAFFKNGIMMSAVFTTFTFVKASVSDPHRFYADPDSVIE